jgi:uncharacterized membrane protein
MIALAYMSAFIAERRSREALLAVHVLLELIIVVCLIASLVITVRLWPHLRDRQLRWPFILNAFVVVAVFGSFVWALCTRGTPAV